METLLYNISQVLGITILHSLWQGLVVYAVIRLFLIGFPAASTNKKYNVLYVGLLTMAVWFAYTFFMEAKTYNWAADPHAPFTLSYDIAPSNNPGPVTGINQPEQPFYYNYKQVIQTYLPYLSALYLLSVLINLIRLAMGWRTIRNIKKQVTTADKWQPIVDKLAARAGIVMPVRINFSNLVDVPCVFGYLKPILLLPVTISTQLSAEETEVIILHELAHIKNNDYVMHLIQQIIALLLFLNPFAQIISKMIDVERENRCDDTVLQISNPLTYAEALVKLEKTRQNSLQLAMAATGKKYHLFARIQRIMGREKPVVNLKHLVFGLLIFIGGVGSIAWLNPEIKDGRLISKNGEAAVQQLGKIVKDVLTPAVSETVKSEMAQDEVVVNTSTDNTSTDSIAKVPVNISVVDTIALRKAKIDALIDEYEKVTKDFQKGIKKLKEIPEGKEAALAQKMFDSVRKIKVVAAFTPEMEQESRDINTLRSKYFNSPEVLKRKAEQNLYYEKISAAIKTHPEMVAFEQEYARLKDSVRNAIMQANNLTESQLQKNAEWNNWKTMAESKKATLDRKLSYLPEIRALLDSVQSIAHWMYSTPEYEALKPKLKLSQAYRDALNPPGLEKYEAELKKAKEKLSKTTLFIKNQQDRKRFEEIQRQLRTMTR